VNERTVESQFEPRIATPSDLPALLELCREYCIADDHAWNAERTRKALTPLLADDQLGVVWVLGAPPVAYAVVTWGYSIESGGRDALLDEVYVRERGGGLGGVLLARVLDDLRGRGLSRVFLETEAPNAEARRFYARHGFCEERSVWMSRTLDAQSSPGGSSDNGVP
jgi:GNAT superfamily N-acetyltransferase